MLAGIDNPALLHGAIPSANLMPSKPTNPQAEFAKLLAAACVRRGYLEKLHAGASPVTRTGDYSDVKVVDGDGREIPWIEVSRISQEEMKTLMTGVVERDFHRNTPDRVSQCYALITNFLIWPVSEIGASSTGSSSENN